MTVEDFETILENQSFNTVIWDDRCAYKPTAYSDDRIELTTMDGFGDYDFKILNRDNCDQFNVRLTGQMKAMLYITQKSMKDNLSRILEMY